MQFRTKARAVDLLGKGQIGDLPTAITELWKNGFDAYADNVTAEIYLTGYKGLKSPLFVMTDDGKGMSKNDIFEKWLVLGTDSKSRTTQADLEGEETLYKKPRIKAGEKGIGRLSVAFLGSPMLMITKKIGYPIQAMFFDWRLLENYNLFLDDIQIPVADVKNVHEFRPIFENLRNEFLLNFDKNKDSDDNPIWEISQQKLKTDIIDSVNSVVIPHFFEGELLNNLLNINDAHGTKFIIFNPIEQLLNILNSDEDRDRINDAQFVRSNLAGFTNQFKENRLQVNTSFPIHKKIGNDYDFLNIGGNFFEPDDFDLADIIIEGIFDGNGGFEGQLNIYGEEPIKYSYTNPRKKDLRSVYGSFRIKLGYSMGNTVDSYIETAPQKKIKNKVTNYGGLYIYRDGFRVLPYGRTEYDFLEFEKRRALRAGSYFFSHRRMFGYIELRRNENENLKDKSSREGLINNAPYRAFKNDLESFFIALADDYFSDKPNFSIFVDKKTELNDQTEAIKKDKARELEAKKAFSRGLKDYPEKFERHQNEYLILLGELAAKVEKSDVIYSEIEDLLEKINRLNINYKKLLPSISRSYKPTDTQLDRLYKYEKQVLNFNETIKKDSEALMLKVQTQLEVKELKKELGKQIQRFKAELETSLDQNKQNLEKKYKELLNDYSQRSNRILKELVSDKESLMNSISTNEDVIKNTNDIQERFEFLREQVEKEISPLVNHIQKLSFDIDEELVQGAYKAEYESIKYRWEQTRETAQLGIAVEIIDHEFNVLYAQINSLLKKLDTELSEDKSTSFNYLKKAFRSLEDKYALLSPLYRISGVTRKSILCSSIYDYIKHFFEGKLKEGNINFTATESFLNHSIEIKEPVIHTVFVNVVNNAIYWLRNVKDKKIIFDYFPETKEILIMNSGLLIENHRIEKIFELFYSNRPNGRGIGLYLSKESLNENYFDIYAINERTYNKLNGACFVIKSLNQL